MRRLRPDTTSTHHETSRYDARILSSPRLLLAARRPRRPAQEKLPDGAKVAKLDVRPAAVELDGPFAYAQLLVTATLDNGETVDVDPLAKFDRRRSSSRVAPPASSGRPPTAAATSPCRSAGSRVDGPGDGDGLKADPPVSFVTDVQPVLSKLGCNAGTCHGRPGRKNGFKLSLRGYDPIFDYRALTDDLEGRRFNRAAPEKSLMLLKPAGAVPHQGGVADAARRPELRTRSAGGSRRA